VKTLRLQEPQNLRERNDVGLLDVLGGVSPDYAIVAQKQGGTEVMTALNAAFGRDYGLSLESLTSRYDMRINAHIAQAENRAQQAETRAQQAETRAQQAETRAQQAENRAQQASHEACAYRQQAESAQARVKALYSSTSWRVTGPLRGLKRALGGDIRPVHEFFAKTTLKIKIIVRPLVARAIRFGFRHPALSAPLSRALKKWPWLHRRLRRVAANTDAMPESVSCREPAEQPQFLDQAGTMPELASCRESGEQPQFLDQAGAMPELASCREPVPVHIANDAGNETLSPHARHIFMGLKKTVAQRQGGAN
jgi:O-antigen chain-terminating methyltransferase